MKDSFKHYYFYGLPVTQISEQGLLNYFQSVIKYSQKRVINGFSLHTIYAIRKIPELFTLGQQADLFLADGRLFFWLCKSVGIPLTSGISIPECVMMAMNFANSNKLKVMLVGATQEINVRAEKNLRNKFQNAIFTNGYHGYFTESKIKDVIQKIALVSPDILLVGMSSPKKEKFVFSNLNEIDAKIIIPCGGMIDVLAGKTKMTPKWLKRLGLATLFRIIQEPQRLFSDRLKMVWFLFTNFFPKLFIKRIYSDKKFSIPEYYCGK